MKKIDEQSKMTGSSLTNKYLLYLFSVLLTYVITIMLTIVMTLIEIDNSSAPLFDFHMTKLPWIKYAFAKVAEVLIPTTVTFCGVTLLFETIPNSRYLEGTIVFICLAVLACLNIAISVLHESLTVIILSIVIVALVVLSVCMAFRSFGDSERRNESLGKHKAAKSDGRIC